MIRQIMVIVNPDGGLELIGEDLPDLAELEALIGPQPIDQALQAVGLDIKLNSRLCG